METVLLTPSKVAVRGRAWFGTPEGFAAGLMRVRSEKDSVELKDISFADGTIEFDMKATGDGLPGIRFRRRGEASAELLYLRPIAACRAEADCLQYVPIVRGVMPWNMYPQYQNRAAVDANGWNHYRLRVSGPRMAVYVNDAPRPALVVGELEGDATSGGIAFQGPALFANVTIARDRPPGPRGAAPDPTLREGRYVRRWRVSPWAAMPLGRMPTLAQQPAPSAAWRTVATERFGVLNLDRLYGSPTGKETGALAWATASIWSSGQRVVHADFGFLSEADVYADGRRVFSGVNMYYPADRRRPPAGRLCITNAGFDLPLRRGWNRIDVALNNILGAGHNHYGWGLSLRLGGRHDGRRDIGCEAEPG